MKILRSLSLGGFRKFFVLFLIFVVAASLSYVFLNSTRGQTPNIFGGRVINSFPCTCSGNFLLTISPPVGGQFVYYPGTQAYESFNLGPASGMWAMGLYTPGGVCLTFSGKGCSPFGLPRGTITPTVGSSLAF